MSSPKANSEITFQTQLFREQMKYIMRTMPKGYALMSSNKSKRLRSKKKVNYGSSADSQSVYSVGKRRPSRNKKNRNFGADYNFVLGNKTYGKSLSETMKKCQQILSKVMKHKYADYFMRPVDPVVLNIPDYFEIIKEPMDLGTVESKLKKGEYATALEFARDVRLIWNNSMKYNPRNTSFYHLTTIIRDYFEKLFREIEENPHGENFPFIAKTVNKYDKKMKNFTNKSVNSRKKAKETAKAMSYQEKRSLSEAIKSLNPDHLHGVWDIVCQVDPNLSKQNELVFDIDKLPIETARNLEKYVKSKLESSNRSNKKKAKNKLVHPAASNQVSTMNTMPANQTPQHGGFISNNVTFPTTTNQVVRGETAGNKSSDSSFFTDSEEDN